MNALHHTETEFATQSQLNTETLNKQNKLLFDHLASGKTINCYEARGVGVLYLNSRISDLRNVHGICVYDWFEKTSGGSSVKRYSFTPKPEEKAIAPTFDLKQIMDSENPFRTICKSNAELLAILGCAEEPKHVAWLYYANEIVVKDDEQLKQTFAEKRDQLKNNETKTN